MPLAIIAEMTPINSVAGEKILTADSALLPTRLPTTVDGYQQKRREIRDQHSGYVLYQLFPRQFSRTLEPLFDLSALITRKTILFERRIHRRFPPYPQSLRLLSTVILCYTNFK